MTCDVVHASQTERAPEATMRPQSAFIMAAGLGKRMRPLTAITPKPLIEVNGKPMLDYNLDHLANSGVQNVVVNAHYLADQIEAHCKAYTNLNISISDERDALLETGGGLKKALPLLGDSPFYTLNGDSFWIEGARPNLSWLMQCWDDTVMDMLLLLAPTVGAIGYTGQGDFLMDPAGALTRRPESRVAPYIYAGATITHPRALKDTPNGPFSLNYVFDRLIETGRLYGVRMDGMLLHVGTPKAIEMAEFAISESAA